MPLLSWQLHVGGVRDELRDPGRVLLAAEVRSAAEGVRFGLLCDDGIFNLFWVLYSRDLKS